MAIITEDFLKDKIHIIRGVQVMLDCDLAEIYGYETRYFNRQVNNNLSRFDNDFRFQLSESEFSNLMCKNYTSRWGGTRKLPYAFTEQGIYMLMTVLKGDLAVQQSKALIRLFKQMKDYILLRQNMLPSSELRELSIQTQNNADEIRQIKQTMVTRDNLPLIMRDFTNNTYPKRLLVL